MWIDDLPGVSPFGGTYPAANDFSAMCLARLDGKCGASFYEYFFIGDVNVDIFK